MKLPEGKKERIQMFVLGGIFAAGLLYVGIAFGLAPMFKAKKERKVKMEQLQEKIKTAQRYLKETADDGARNYDALSKAKAFSEEHVLKPRLGGNYLLVVTEMVEQWAQESGLKISPPSEIGAASIPQTDPARNVVRSYSFAISTSGGTPDLIRLLKIIEKENPCFAVTRLSVVGDAAVPLKHAVSIALQQPIWDNHEEMAARLAAELQSNAKYKK